MIAARIDSATDWFCRGCSSLFRESLRVERARFRSLPITIRTDQGPEFTGNALDQWAYYKVELRLIEAGKPTQNAYVESFNGKFRDESSNEHWFRSLSEAREIIATWTRDYNQQRPHSSLGYQHQRSSAQRGAQGMSGAPSTSNRQHDNFGLYEPRRGS
jgi:putative transposase